MCNVFTSFCVLGATKANNSQKSSEHRITQIRTMIWTILLVILLLAVGWLILGDRNPVDILPGPPRRPFVGSLFQFMMVRPREMFKMVREFTVKYPDRFVVQILRRRIVHVYNPNDIEAILSHSKNISKSKPYRFLIPWLGTGLLISTGSKWFHRRKILTPTFHFNILRRFAPIIEEKSRALVSRLKKEPQPVDLFPIISDFTLYTICETAMGTQLDQDTSSSTLEYKSAIQEIGGLMLDRLTRVWLHPDFVYKNLPVGKHFEKVLTKVHTFADRVIRERKSQERESSAPADTIDGDDVFGGKKRVAMLDLLLDAEGKGEIDLEGIREEVNTFMFEGHDTTATALTFGLMLIADHEDVQNHILKEQRAIFGQSDRVASLSDLAEMKYLEAVVKETLRLYPSVPFIARETTEDFKMGDLSVVRGTEIAIHPFDLHRRPDTFPAPEVFKPERFLSGETRHPYAYIPFSAGPRNCIGQRFAMQEMKCALSEICRNFRLEPKVKGWRPELVSDLVLRSLDPIYVKFIPRN